MLNAVYEWVKNVAFYLIFITAIMNALPDNHFKKYVRLFTGMILVVVLISPISRLLQIEKDLDFSFITKSYELELEEVQKQIGNVENMQSEQLLSGYEETIKTKVDEIVREEGMNLSSIEIILNKDAESAEFGEMQKMELRISLTEEDEEKILIDKIRISEGKNGEEATLESINIKNKIMEYYGIAPENINIISG